MRSSGTIAVEFAVIFPAAIALLLGGIDLGRMIACRTMLTYAAAEGVQKAAALLTANVTTVEGVVIGDSPMLGLTASDIDVLVDPSATENATTFAGRTTANTVSVRARYTFRPMIYPAWSITFTETSASMRVQ